MRALGAVAIILSLSSCTRRTPETAETQQIRLLASIDQIRSQSFLAHRSRPRFDMKLRAQYTPRI